MKALFRVVDLETNDLAPPDEVIEIGWTDVIWDSSARQAVIFETSSRLFKPKEALKMGAQAVHHITAAELEGLKPFSDIDARLLLSGDPWALVAHQADFERQWLTEEVMGPARWLDTYKIALRLWPDAPGHGLQALRYFLGLDLDPAKAMPPHRAGPDTHVTAHLFAECLKLATVREMDLWTRMPRYFARCPLKKHKGAKWEDVPGDYLKWIVTGSNEVEEGVKQAARDEQNRRAGVK